HFYHTDSKRTCRLKGKTEKHLQTQKWLQNSLPHGESSLEYPFPSIGRIADVAWHPKKIVFEVQCSPITPHEVEARNRDYASIGYQVIWILHDVRYKQRWESAAEVFLRDHPHYYTNIDENGEGCVYDVVRLRNSELDRRLLGPHIVAVNEVKVPPKNCSHLPL